MPIVPEKSPTATVQREAGREQQIVDLDQAIGDRDQIIKDRQQATLDEEQASLDRHVADEGLATPSTTRHQEAVHRSQVALDQYQEALDGVQEVRDERQEVLDVEQYGDDAPDVAPEVRSRRSLSELEDRVEAAMQRAWAARIRADEMLQRAKDAERRVRLAKEHGDQAG